MMGGFEFTRQVELIGGPHDGWLIELVYGIEHVCYPALGPLGFFTHRYLVDVHHPDRAVYRYSDKNPWNGKRIIQKNPPPEVIRKIAGMFDISAELLREINGPRGASIGTWR